VYLRKRNNVVLSIVTVVLTLLSQGNLTYVTISSRLYTRTFFSISIYEKPSAVNAIMSRNMETDFFTIIMHKPLVSSGAGMCVLLNFGTNMLPQPLCSLDLVPATDYLFQRTKALLKGQKVQSTEEVKGL
jgi:hypothetical protein